ncbi:caspase family protein, partial [bacterium]|nr:caspase family protein [bacterium]
EDERATRAQVEKLFQILAQGTKPGDEIFLYWTGHGASVADTDGDEKDGMDEVLVTYDASRDDVGRTGVLDDVLRRWVQDLDGRRVIFIADVCLAGGFAGTGKGLETKGAEGASLFSELKGEQPPSGTAGGASKSLFDFFDSEWVQTKDIGQKETAVLCSSADKEVSLVRPDGASSVMTGFMADFVSQSGRSVTLKAAYDHVKAEVPKYVRAQFPGMDQQPQFLDNLSSPVYLRP